MEKMDNMNLIQHCDDTNNKCNVTQHFIYCQI